MSWGPRSTLLSTLPRTLIPPLSVIFPHVLTGATRLLFTHQDSMQCDLVLKPFLTVFSHPPDLVTPFLALSVLHGHYLFLQFGAKLSSDYISLSFTPPAPGSMPGTPEARTGRGRDSTPLGCG